MKPAPTCASSWKIRALKHKFPQIKSAQSRALFLFLRFGNFKESFKGDYFSRTLFIKPGVFKLRSSK